MKNAALAFTQLRHFRYESVLDIGAGSGEHTQAFREQGKQVTAIDWSQGEDFNTMPLDPVDCVWASHVLEHQLNVQAFLEKCVHLSQKVIAITVPPLKSMIVGGHVSLWNAGLLLYRLVLAGNDCSAARVKTYGYNCSVIVPKSPIQLPPLNYDAGDLDTLAPYFPVPITRDRFPGDIAEWSWA